MSEKLATFFHGKWSVNSVGGRYLLYHSFHKGCEILLLSLCDTSGPVPTTRKLFAGN